MVNDTIADMLTRIRNANAMKYKTVEIPGTKMTKSIADILTKEGFIAGYDVNKLAVGEMLVVNLKYSKSKERELVNQDYVCMLKLMKCQEFLMD